MTENDAPTEITSQSKEKAEKVRVRRGVLPFFNLLLIFALAGGGGYAWWIYQPELLTTSDLAPVSTEVQELNNQLAGIERLVDSISSDLRIELERKIATQHEANAQQIEGNQTQLEGLNSELKRIEQSFSQIQDNGNTNQNPLEPTQDLYELVYLITLARNQLNLWGDSEGALISLKDLDNELATQDDPAFDEVRKVILENIQAIENLATSDRTGIFIRLAGLSEEIEFLILTGVNLDFRVASNEESAALGKPEETESSGWRSYLDRLFNLVQIRNIEHPSPTRLLSDEEQRLIRLRLSLGVQQASYALLYADQELFTRTLENTLEIATQHLDDREASTQSFITGLNETMQHQVQVSRPNLDTTARLLTRVVETKVEDVLSQRTRLPVGSTPTTKDSGNDQQ